MSVVSIRCCVTSGSGVNAGGVSAEQGERGATVVDACRRTGVRDDADDEEAVTTARDRMSPDEVRSRSRGGGGAGAIEGDPGARVDEQRSREQRQGDDKETSRVLTNPGSHV